MKKDEEALHVFPLFGVPHFTDGRECWCDPRIEKYQDRTLVVHNTVEQAQKKAN